VLAEGDTDRRTNAHGWIGEDFKGGSDSESGVGTCMIINRKKGSVGKRILVRQRSGPKKAGFVT
jgi:hypothetical protein